MKEQAQIQLHVTKERIWTRDFVLICLANFFIFLGFQMTLPTIPLFVEHLGGSDQLIGIITGVFTFSALLFRPYAGHSLETKGRQFVYMLGLAIFVLSVGSFGFAFSIAFLFVLRTVQGIGWSFSTTATGTIATDLIPPKRRGEGMGYFGLSGNLAMAIGPALGLTLAGSISFTMLFLICAALGAVALTLSTKVRYKKVEPPKEPTTRAKFDIFEKTAIKPSLLLFFITITFGGISTFLPLYTVQKEIAGIEMYFLIFALFLMISRTFSGRIYDAWGHIAVFLPGTFIVFIAMILLAWLPSSTVLFTAAALYGLGFGSVSPALQAWSVNQAPNDRKAMANATFFSFFDLGVGVGAVLFGQIAFLFGYQEIYIASAASVFVSMMLYIVLLQKERRKTT
ncbi:MFS transporter [Bacillus aerolatus]|uniref:MFS transporter n=1 Tax=Bacillus aerolatus TaxID=2653354 RepID=A0A6I1FH38_9BACI|nr:MFS transporter [Bacillus aerolatus]KAB7707576.1 MFS transporter [Bacillus aerolatus]